MRRALRCYWCGFPRQAGKKCRTCAAVRAFTLAELERLGAWPPQRLRWN